MPETPKCFEDWWDTDCHDDLPPIPFQPHECGWPVDYCAVCDAMELAELRETQRMIDGLRAELHP